MAKRKPGKSSHGAPKLAKKPKGRGSKAVAPMKVKLRPKPKRKQVSFKRATLKKEAVAPKAKASSKKKADLQNCLVGGRLAKSCLVGWEFAESCRVG